MATREAARQLEFDRAVVAGGFIEPADAAEHLELAAAGALDHRVVGTGDAVLEGALSSEDHAP